MERSESIRQRPIFIIGCQRSGTTLLRAMLTSHPNIAIPYEAHRFSTMLSVSHPWDHVWVNDQVRQPIEEFLGHPKPSQWGLTTDDVLRELGSARTFRFADLIRAFYQAYARKEGKLRWGDKTPSNTFELSYLVREFPDAQFVHIIRDGRDVYLSWSKVDWGHYAVEKAAKKWTKWVQTAADQRRTLGRDRYLEVRYENLVRRLAETLETICTFLREPFDESMLHYYANGKSYIPEEERKHLHPLLSTPPDASRAGAWQQQMARKDIRVFERVAGATLIPFGYPISRRGRVLVVMDAVVGRIKRLIKQALQMCVTLSCPGRDSL